MKKRLNSYQGKLTSAQIAQGMNAAATNAQRLVSDASALLEGRRFPTAASLAILAIEEAGKISILRSLPLARTNSELLNAWKDYRSHTRKNVAWIMPQLFAEGARNSTILNRRLTRTPIILTSSIKLNNLVFILIASDRRIGRFPT